MLFGFLVNFTLVVIAATFAHTVRVHLFAAAVAGNKVWHGYFPCLRTSFIASGFRCFSFWANHFLHNLPKI